MSLEGGSFKRSSKSIPGPILSALVTRRRGGRGDRSLNYL
jgi:hypothetical protein